MCRGLKKDGDRSRAADDVGIRPCSRDLHFLQWTGVSRKSWRGAWLHHGRGMNEKNSPSCFLLNLFGWVSFRSVVVLSDSLWNPSPPYTSRRSTELFCAFGSYWPTKILQQFVNATQQKEQGSFCIKVSPLQRCGESSHPAPHAGTILLLAPRQTLHSWVLLRLQRLGMENSSSAERDLF